MEALNNSLLMFNSDALLNRREVLESFDDFVEHHRLKDNEEGYSEGKRKVLLSLCDEFRSELMKLDIPALTKPWFFYEYSVNNDSIDLSLLKCEEFEFDYEDMTPSMTTSIEYTLAEVKCDYLTVEKYAEIYGVTTTTVRQWIRRGKLRTAKKVGRDWLIPALADKPKRGFESVTYYWTDIDKKITDAFPFLAGSKCVFIAQNEDDKTKFHAITNWPGVDYRQSVLLSSKEREQLEIMMISAPDIHIEDVNTQIRYIPAKRDFKLPILSSRVDNEKDKDFSIESIVVQQHSSDTFWFYPNYDPGDALGYDHTDTYLIPFFWEFWGVPNGCDDDKLETIYSGDYSDCQRIGDASGTLILCKQMISDGYDPLTACDDKSADLEYVMSALVDEGGPLNEDTGETLLDVLYIHELAIDTASQGEGLGSRILQELPSLSLKFMHVAPDLLVYYPAPTKHAWYRKSESENALRNSVFEKVAEFFSVSEDSNADTNRILSDEKHKLNDDEVKIILGQRRSGTSYPEDLKNKRLYEFYYKNGFQELCDTRLLYAYTDM